MTIGCGEIRANKCGMTYVAPLGKDMTEQPKFQRRKRRGPVVPARTPKKRADTSEAAQALLAEKEALLQRMTELEANRDKARHTKPEDEPTTPEKAAVDKNTSKDTSPLFLPPTAAVKPKRLKSKQPLVLAQPPEPPVEKALPDPESNWANLDRFALDAQRLARKNIITARRKDPAHARFDILRTRMLQALSENGWKRVAITSPTKDCGKTFTAANLAISLSRQENCRTVLLDLDMRSPSLHQLFGVSDPGVVGDMLRGDIAPERHLQRFGENDISAGSHVAVGFNGMIEPYASELLQDPSTENVLSEIEEKFASDVMLFDLPPALLNDDVIAMRPHFDALLLIAGGGVTRADEIKETERRLGEKVPLLGVVLNKADTSDKADYTY